MYAGVQEAGAGLLLQDQRLAAPPRRGAARPQQAEYPAPATMSSATMTLPNEVIASLRIGASGLSGSSRTRACPVDHGTGSRSQIRIDARSTVPWYMNSRLS